MKKVLGIMILSLILFTSESFSSMNGQGPLKIKDDILDVLLNYYFNPQNKRDRPTTFAITKTGDMLGYSVCPARYAGDCILRPTAALRACKQNVKKYLKRKERCWVFAKERKIVWNNLNIEIPRGTSNSSIKKILIENSLYGENRKKKLKEPKTETKKVITKEITKNDNLADQIKQLKKLLDDGVITQKEFEKAKKKVLN